MRALRLQILAGQKRGIVEGQGIAFIFGRTSGRYGSDAQSYLDVGRSAGATDLIMRPADLASDEASKLDVLRHCLAEVEQATASNFDTLVDLQVTSPFRTKRDISAAVQLLENDSVAQNVVSATLSKKSPYFTVFENNEEGFAGVCKNLGGAIVRRQDVPKTYDLNGSIYVWRRDTILRASQVTQDRTRIFEMSEHQSLDIDTPLDLFIARQVAELFDWETGELKI